VGPDVKILGHAAQEQVADASADQVGLVAGAREPVKDLQRVRIDLAPGNRVLAARPDARRGGFRGVFDWDVRDLGRRSRIANRWSPSAAARAGLILAEMLVGIDLLTFLRALRKNTLLSPAILLEEELNEIALVALGRGGCHGSARHRLRQGTNHG